VEPFVVSTSEGDIHGWHYEGEGPQAVLLHGGPCISASYMASVVPHLAGVFRQSLYQQRGLAPTTVEGPFTVEANVADAAAVIDETAGGRAWIVGHSWGGHLALQMLAAIPERVAGAIIVDPLGAHLDAMPEFGERLQAPLSEKDRARVREIEAKEEAGTATPEESLEDFRLVWPSYFADPASAPPMPEMDMAVQPFTATMASIAEHSEAGTLVRGLPAVPAEIPVLFLHGAASPMPLRASTDTAALIPHARVEIVEGAGHFIWLERPGAVRDAVRDVV
jgi:pimeloyl-ACP methyl ester carboxylesterase